MKATELRIGNYVYNKTDGVIKVEEVNDDGINGEFDLCWASYYFEPTYAGVEKDLIEPIPLTEEWLLKFGFNSISEVNSFTENYWNKNKDCSIDVETYITTKGIERIYRYIISSSKHFELKRTKSIMYVHQLQNLVFALTGEELEIK